MPAAIQPPDPRVDACIEKAAPFARPILAHLRAVVRAACPAVDETIKWSMPFFDDRGAPLGNMAAFQAHCAFGCWRGKEITDLPRPSGGDAMGHLGRILSLDDLPPKRELAGLVQAAIKLNEAEVKPVRAKKPPKPVLATPDDFAAALQRVPAAATQFDQATPGVRREYIAWIVEAKRAETRAARIATAVEWIAEGKSRHWKYQGS